MLVSISSALQTPVFLSNVFFHLGWSAIWQVVTYTLSHLHLPHFLAGLQHCDTLGKTKQQQTPHRVSSAFIRPSPLLSALAAQGILNPTEGSATWSLVQQPACILAQRWWTVTSPRSSLQGGGSVPWGDIEFQQRLKPRCLGREQTWLSPRVAVFYQYQNARSHAAYFPCASPSGSRCYCQRVKANTSSNYSSLALPLQQQGQPCGLCGQPWSASQLCFSRSKNSLALTLLPQKSKIRCYVCSAKIWVSSARNNPLRRPRAAANLMPWQAGFTFACLL